MGAGHREQQNVSVLQVRHPVRWMKIAASVYGLVFAGLGTWAVLEDEPQEIFQWTLAYIALATYGLVILLGALRLQFEISEGTIRYRGFVSKAQVPIVDLTGVFVERYDGGVFSFLKGPRFVRVIVIQGDFGVKQLDGTAGRERNVQRVKNAIMAHLPEGHPQRSDEARGPGGAHRKTRKEPILQLTDRPLKTGVTEVNPSHEG